MRFTRIRFTRRSLIILGVLALTAAAFVLGVGVGKGVPYPKNQNTGQGDGVLSADPPPKETAQAGASGMPAVQAEETRLSVVDSNGVLVWELEAAVVEGRDDNQSVSLKQVTARRYEKGRAVATVTAPEASLLGGTGEVRFSGGVTARVLGSRKENQQIQETQETKETQEIRETWLEALELAWDPQRQVLVAEGKVRVQQGPRIMTGDRLTGDGNLQRVRLEGHVKVRSYQNSAGEAGAISIGEDNRP